MSSPRDELRRLRAEIVARDTFFARVSTQLDARVAELRAALTGDTPGTPLERFERVEGLARELALIARPAHPPAKERARRVDLAEIVRDFCERHRPHAEHVGRGFTIDAAAPAPIVADPEDVERILGELLSNAIKYGRDVVRIQVATRGARVELAIRDGGPGVPPALRRHVFRRYARGPSARPDTGYGVGMWLSRKVARAWGGDVTLGDGVVRVRFPRAM